MLEAALDQINNPPPPHDGVYRDKKDCPMVFEPEHPGPFDFTQGKTVKGRRGYARVTSFINVLEDESNIDKYHSRNVIIGFVKKPHLLVEARDALGLGTPDDGIVKDALNHLAMRAREAADEQLKADRGTAVHRWCQEVDESLAAGKSEAEALAALSQEQHVGAYTFQIQTYYDDVVAWIDVRRGLLRAVHIEKLHINDTLRVAGTPDRVDVWEGPPTLVPGTAVIIQPGDLLEVDLKTGNVDYSIGKFACQLGTYGSCELYDQATNTRTPMPARLRRDWGLIIHIPAGGGEAAFIWIDIAAGWQAVNDVATRVRKWRTASKKVAAVHGKDATLTDRINAAFTAAEMRELWSANQDAWTPELSALAAARVEALQPKDIAA